jgi:hypothetical protein
MQLSNERDGSEAFREVTASRTLSREFRDKYANLVLGNREPIESLDNHTRKMQCA